MGTSIEYPDVPFEIVGDGSYKNPFSVPLTPLGFQAIEFIFWLDPDGLPSVKALDMAKDSIEPQLRDMLETQVAPFLVGGVSGVFSLGWDPRFCFLGQGVSSEYVRLSGSPRVIRIIRLLERPAYQNGAQQEVNLARRKMQFMTFNLPMRRSEDSAPVMSGGGAKRWS